MAVTSDELHTSFSKSTIYNATMESEIANVLALTHNKTKTTTATTTKNDNSTKV